MSPTVSTSAVEALLRDAHIGNPFSLLQIPFGRNNQVFEIHTDSGRFIVKRYFQSPFDPRDRMQTELAFYRFAVEREVAALPRVLATNELEGCILLTYVEGRRIQPGSIDNDLVDQAITFFKTLNTPSVVGAKLPDASEACHSVSSYVDIIDGRLSRLSAEVSDGEVRRFLLDDLIPLWSQVRERAESDAGDRFEETLSIGNRCVSPSDFGFHNALVNESGQATFIDFEYAGLDDPARAVCDFFCQVAVPIPLSYIDNMVLEIQPLLQDPEWFRQRVEILMPLSRVKWCCHILNNYLPDGGERGRFSGHEALPSAKARQLRSARSAFEALTRNLANTFAA